MAETLDEQIRRAKAIAWDEGRLAQRGDANPYRGGWTEPSKEYFGPYGMGSQER